jgi:hypothetical protein
VVAPRAPLQTMLQATSDKHSKSGCLNGCALLFLFIVAAFWLVIFLLDAIHGTKTESSANYSGVDLRNMVEATQGGRELRKRLYGLQQRCLTSGQVETGLTTAQRILRLVPVSALVVVCVASAVVHKARED